MAKKSKDQVKAKKEKYMGCIFGDDLDGMSPDDFAKRVAKEAWNAAVCRGYRFYAKNASQPIRDELRDFAISKVISIGVPKGAGTAHITQLQNAVNTHRAHRALNGGAMRFGRAQKFVNMYFKYMWCARKISTPPHCPFDRQIIDEQLPHRKDEFWGKYGGLKVLEAKKKHRHIWTWTKSDCVGDYEVWLEAAEYMKDAQGYRSLSEWELFEYRLKGC